MGLWALPSPDAPLDVRIASVAMFLGGLAFVAMYRNFYVVPRQYEVAFRSIFGREHVLPYRDIARYSLQRARGQPILTVKSVHGVKLSLNTITFDVGPMLQAIDYHRVTGSWPVPPPGADSDRAGDSSLDSQAPPPPPSSSS